MVIYFRAGSHDLSLDSAAHASGVNVCLTERFTVFSFGVFLLMVFLLWLVG
jgi:hypothetical protein